MRDKVYKTYDNVFPNRRTREKHFREIVDTIKAIFGDDLAQSEFRAIRLLFPLFCAVAHMNLGLPKLKADRAAMKAADYPKFKAALEAIDDLVEKAEPGTPNLPADDHRFLDAYTVHWVHADKRVILADTSAANSRSR